MTKLTFHTHGNQKQKEAFRILFSEKYSEVGYGGGAGGGKSYLGVAWQWMVRNKYPNTTGFFGRKELKNLKRTTLATYFKFLDDYSIPDAQRGSYNAQDGLIRFQNGSIIHLLDLAHQPSDPLYTRFGSLELTDGFVDESNEVEPEALNILHTRVGRQKNEEYNITPKILQTFNPDKGHVYRNFYKPYKESNLPDYRDFIPALATDNKLLPKSYIQQLERSDEVTRQRLLFGNFDYDDTPGRLFEYNALHDLWTNAKTTGTKYITCDVARFGDDRTVIAVWDEYNIVDIQIFKGYSTVQVTDEIKKLQSKHRVRMSHTIVDEDGVGGGVVDQLRCRGFINNSRPVSPISKKYLPEMRRNYENLKTQCFFMLGEAVNAGDISISTETGKQDIIDELDSIVQIDIDKEGPLKIIKKEDIKGKLGRSPDYADAIMMRMFFELNKPGEGGETITFDLMEDPYNQDLIDKEQNMLPDEYEEAQTVYHSDIDHNPYSD